AGACARGATSRPVNSATAHAGMRTLRMRPSVAECVQLRIWNLEFGMRTSPPVVSGFNRTGSRIPNSKFLIPNSGGSEADGVPGGIAYEKTAVARFDWDVGAAHAQQHVGNGGVGREHHIEVAQADGAGRRRRRADAGPRVQADVMMVAAGRDEQG